MSFSLVFTIILAPFHYVSQKNEQELQSRFDSLDNQTTEVFNSTSNCVKKDYLADACKASEENALDTIGFGTKIEYSNINNCFNNHGSCSKGVKYILIGKVLVPKVYYQPYLVGWQAAKKDLSDAVPLYGSARWGMALRGDGKSFSLRR